MVDLAKYDLDAKAESGVTVALVDPVDGTDLGASVTVKGMDSPTYRNKLAELIKKRGHYSSMTPDDDCEVLGACTIGMEGLELDGKPITDYAEAYKRFNWLRVQVNAAALDRKAVFNQPVKS
jgi:hypothetical protein